MPKDTPAPAGVRTDTRRNDCRTLATRLLAIVAMLIPCGAAHAQQQRLTVVHYSNLVNRHFASISNGPQSSVVLDADAAATDDDIKAMSLRAAKSVWTSQARTLSRQIGLMQKSGMLKARSIIPISSIIAVRRNGQIVLPAATEASVSRAAGTRSVGGGTLTFTYSGFNSTDEAFLQQVETQLYPAIVAVYGQPAVSGTVEVVNAGSLDTSTITDVQRLAFGSYNVSTNQILLPIFASNEQFVQAFLLNMLHAFHGPAVFQYDAWEQGFARAAAAVIARNTATTVGITDPTSSGLIDLLSYYDLLNQPSLGNSTFFPPSQAQLALDSEATIGAMLYPRLGMSGAVWLKVYIENPQFFAQFNAAYYAQFNAKATPSLAGNVPALQALASPLLPNGVEGTAWSLWYQEQYILDTAASSGEQLYAFVNPGPYDPTDSTAGQSTAIDLVYYTGQGTGDETLTPSATAYATYLDSTDARLDLGVASEEAAISNGEGTLTTLLFPTQGVDSGRITMNFHAGNASTTSYLASGFTGDFQAVVLGPNATGSVVATESTVPSVIVRTQNTTITNSAFGVTLGSTVTDLAVNTITITYGPGVNSTYKINTGDGQYYAVIRRGATGGGVVTESQNFATNDLPYLVSFPVQPLNTIVDQALGLPGSAFALSYWNVDSNSYQTLVPGTPSIAPITLGRGYWFKLEPSASYTSQTVSVTGMAPSTDTDFVMTCPYGWNLVGSPFLTSFNVSDIYVQYEQNDAVDFPTAVSDSLIAASPFSWDQATASYAAATTMGGATWQGYWLQVLVPGGVTLLMPGPDATGRAAKARSSIVGRSATVKSVSIPSPEWAIQLRASQADTVLLGAAARTVVANASFGVGQSVKANGFDNRYDLAAPPPIVSSLTIQFPHPEWTAPGASHAYVSDFRATAVSSPAWTLQVATPKSGPVTVSWVGLGSVPQTTRLTLVDSVAGTSTPLRNRSSYTFTATAGQTRSLQIVADVARSNPLAINGVVAVPTRSARVAGSGGGSSVNISYIVSDQATVNIQMSAINGRIVRHLPQTRATTANSIQTTTWDGRGDNGQALPAGLYHLQITARADDGTQVHYERPILLLQ